MSQEPENILSQPLLTSEGFLNPACMNELDAAIKGIPPDHIRLAGDPEWTVERWTSHREIVGFFAACACRQSPYGCPDNLEKVIKYLIECLKREISFDLDDNLAKLSLCRISEVLHKILDDLEYFKEWNRAKKGKTPDVVFVSAFSKSDPDYHFIDTDALIRNVCIHIRTERRENDLFDKKFEESNAK